MCRVTTKVLWALLGCGIAWSSVCAQQTALPQEKKAVLLPRPAPRIPRRSIVMSAGLTVPVSHHHLTDFWSMGPGGSVAFFAHVHRLVSVGVGVDGSMVFFRSGAFETQFPGVSSEKRNLGLLHLYLAWRYAFVSKPPVSPFIGASVGAAKATSAVFETTVNGIRATYYEIPGRTRLAVAGVLGADFFLDRTTAVEVEGKAVYLYNDPEVGLVVSVRAGVRLFFY
jgi:hypothetical protein